MRAVITLENAQFWEGTDYANFKISESVFQLPNLYLQPGDIVDTITTFASDGQSWTQVEIEEAKSNPGEVGARGFITTRAFRFLEIAEPKKKKSLFWAIAIGVALLLSGCGFLQNLAMCTRFKASVEGAINDDSPKWFAGIETAGFCAPPVVEEIEKTSARKLTPRAKHRVKIVRAARAVLAEVLPSPSPSPLPGVQ